MELTWPMRMRIAVAAAVGVVLIGILAWPLVAPADPFGILSITAGNITAADVAIVLALAFCCGLVAYWLAWPYGREIGILAVPAGLAVWAVRSGNIAGCLQTNPALSARRHLYDTFMWEPVVWLAIVAAGFAGVLLSARIKSPPPPAEEQSGDAEKARYSIFGYFVAFAGSAVLAMLIIGIIAQDVQIPDEHLGSVVGQPAIGQIVFAVLLAFGAAAFAVKLFLNANYLASILASAVVTALAIKLYGSNAALEHVAGYYPAPFFPNPVLSILPIQIVAFGSLGSVAGYWLAVQYSYWRTHHADGR